MSEFSVPLAGFRIVDTLHGDTLQAVALRELGDASRWVDLANINKLLPPYITDDASLASDRVLLSGGQLVVPAQTPVSANARTSKPDDLYGLDLGLINGDLTDDGNGDFVVFNGQANLRQALVHRVITERSELMFHPEYGCLVRQLIGAVNGPTAATLAARYVSATLAADPRVTSVTSVTATVAGDAINVVAIVVPITGSSTKIEVSI